jgi:putative nucleotidyltransferase with HDIG domain
MYARNNIHFRLLEDIARELSGEVNFPTCMDAAMMVRNTLKDHGVGLDKVLLAVSMEPLIASKLLQLANSVTYNPSGKIISDLATAVQRLGFDVVRTVSLAVAMDQMLKSRNLAGYQDIAHQVWAHSIQTAAIARVLARRLGRVNPDDAMMAGLVHDIGIFYLLYRASEYPEYMENRAAVLELIQGWHEGIGESLLHALGIPERICDAVRDHEHLRQVDTPCTVRDVLYFANLLGGDDSQWRAPEEIDDGSQAQRAADRERFQDLIAEAEEDIAAVRASLHFHE